MRAFAAGLLFLVSVAAAEVAGASAVKAGNTDITKSREQKIEEQTMWLFGAYRHYAFVKYCNETRQGYSYVDGSQLGRARRKIGTIEDQSLAFINKGKDENLDTSALWNKAVSSIKGLNVDAGSCQAALKGLLTRYPTNYDADSVLQKDF